jgi:hypothetical protein
LDHPALSSSDVFSPRTLPHRLDLFVSVGQKFPFQTGTLPTTLDAAKPVDLNLVPLHADAPLPQEEAPTRWEPFAPQLPTLPAAHLNLRPKEELIQS